VLSIKYQCGSIKIWSVSLHFNEFWIANLRIYEHIRYENYDFMSQKWEKNKSKVRFVESSFGQKVRSTFPIAQWWIVSPFQWRHCCLFWTKLRFLLLLLPNTGHHQRVDYYVRFLSTIMNYFSRNSLWKNLADTIDFNKWHLKKICWRHRATLQNFKATWTSLLTNDKAKSTFTRRFLHPNRPLTWALTH